MKIPIPPTPLSDELLAFAREFDASGRQPAEPRDAATVLLLRDSAAGPEIYYLRRQASMAFAAGACVYPGGGVDPRDFDREVAWAGPSAAEWGERLGCDPETARALVCAAVRETFEESGVLLAGPDVDTVVADTTGDDWEADRAALESRELALTEFLTRRGLVLRTDLLGVWSAWLTPAFEPKRFRTWFFAALLPEGQRTREVSRESDEVLWLPARETIARADRGEMAMMPPTYLTTLDVAQYEQAADVIAEAHTRAVVMHTPAPEPFGDKWTLSIPDVLRPVLARHIGA